MGVYLIASLINTSDFRDPRKKDLVNIKSIESDKLIRYPYLALLIRSYSRMTYGRSTSKITERLKVYSVVLLNSTHRNRIKVGGFYTKQEAIEMINDIAKRYDKKIVKYSPKISEATKMRMR